MMLYWLTEATQIEFIHYPFSIDPPLIPPLGGFKIVAQNDDENTDQENTGQLLRFSRIL